jgi:hypothetical protein
MSNPIGILTGSTGKRAASASASALENGINNAQDAQTTQYNNNTALEKPLLDSGMQGYNALNYGLGLGNASDAAYSGVNTGTTGAFGNLTKSFGTSDFQTDPGYQFAISEGQKALDRNASAKQGYLSGAAIKGLERFNQDTATNQYQNSYNRYVQNQNNAYNKFSNSANQGINATANQQNLNTAYGNNLAGLATDRGSAEANGIIGANNANTQGLMNTVNLAGNVIGAYNGLPSMNSLTNNLPSASLNQYNQFGTTRVNPANIQYGAAGTSAELPWLSS